MFYVETHNIHCPKNWQIKPFQRWSSQKSRNMTMRYILDSNCKQFANDRNQQVCVSFNGLLPWWCSSLWITIPQPPSTLRMFKMRGMSKSPYTFLPTTVIYIVSNQCAGGKMCLTWLWKKKQVLTFSSLNLVIKISFFLLLYKSKIYIWFQSHYRNAIETMIWSKMNMPQRIQLCSNDSREWTRKTFKIVNHFMRARVKTNAEQVPIVFCFSNKWSSISCSWHFFKNVKACYFLIINSYFLIKFLALLMHYLTSTEKKSYKYFGIYQLKQSINTHWWLDIFQDVTKCLIELTVTE